MNVYKESPEGAFTYRKYIKYAPSVNIIVNNKKGGTTTVSRLNLH